MTIALKTQSPLRPTKKLGDCKGFTLIEIGVALTIIAIIVAIAIASLSNTKADASEKNAQANAKTINEAITRATLKGDTNPLIGSNANDVEAAAAYLIDQGYIR